MTKPKPVLLLEKRDENRYSLSKSIGKITDYFGKRVKTYHSCRYYGEISLLLNEKTNHYAIIYERQIPALSGPPGEETQLLLAGTEEHFKILQKDSLEELTLNAALHEARRLAKKEGLIVRKRL